MALQDARDGLHHKGCRIVVPFPSSLTQWSFSAWSYTTAPWPIDRRSRILTVAQYTLPLQSLAKAVPLRLTALVVPSAGQLRTVPSHIWDGQSIGYLDILRKFQ